MAMSVVYGNFAGEVVYESREGEERWYVPDTLGSTQALVDDTGSVTDTYDYWSYEEEREHVGDSPTDLTFLGVLGYVKDLLNRLYYVRARHLRPELARWQTVDPLWPSEMAYVYADDKPAYIVDPTGLWWVRFVGCSGSEIAAITDAFNVYLNVSSIDPDGDCGQSGGGFLGCASDKCQPTGGTNVGSCLCPHLNASGNPPTMEVRCNHDCPSGKCGSGWKKPSPPHIELCFPQATSTRCGPLQCLIAHELIHMCGVAHSVANNPGFTACVSGNISGCAGYK